MTPAVAIEIAIRVHGDHCECAGSLSCGLVEIDGMDQQEIVAAARKPVAVGK